MRHTPKTTDMALLSVNQLINIDMSYLKKRVLLTLPLFSICRKLVNTF